MQKLVLRLTLVAMLLAGSFASLRPAVSAPPEPAGLLESLAAQAGPDLRVGYHRGTGLVNFIGSAAPAPVYLAPASAAAATAEDGAQQFLAAYGPLFGLTDPAKELIVQRSKTLADGRAYVRYQQQYQGVPVLGGELIVGLDAARNVLSAGGEILPKISVSTQPVFDAAAAQQLALEATAAQYGLAAADLTATAPTLWLYDPVLLRADKRSSTRLVWRLEVSPDALSDIRELVLVDAVNGKIALSINQIDTAMNRLTFTASHGTLLPGSLLCNQAQSNCSDAHATAAHLHAGQTYSMYVSLHGRDSIDGAGLPLTSTVRFNLNYFNAFWNGNQMVYGDGAGYPLADDVVGHELTHGVTQYESNLFYYYQSGAINESFSDVWGEILDQTNGTGNDAVGVKWDMGEDVAGSGALRDMANPPAFNDPDRMTSSLYNEGSDDAGSNDLGGVHTNSGVNNKAAYLMADGGVFNGRTVTALGLTKVAKLYYEVQTNLLTSGADYLDLYNALNQACSNLVVGLVLTAGDCVEVEDATLAVEMNLPPATNYNAEASLCPGGGVASVLYFDNMEAPSGEWTTGALTGSNRWGYFDGYAFSGVTSWLGNDFPAATTDTYLQLNPALGALPASAFMHFHHAYGFEAPNYDGGVLEYSTNGGGAWTDAGTLIQSQGYTGVLAGSNPLGARSAFVSDSHGYISSRVNLTSLAGQTVIFRWRMGLDSSVADEGWWVDNVTIYTCAAPAYRLFVPLVRPAVVPGPQPGFWDGQFEEFYVTNDRLKVDDFAIYISVNGCGNYKITSNLLVPIVNHTTFSFGGSFYASGTFTSQTTATGTEGLSGFVINGCGSVSGGPFGWSINWQHASAAITFQPAYRTGAGPAAGAAEDPNYLVEQIP